MTKIVYNKCYGGFGLSKKAVERYFQLMGWGLVVVRDEYGWPRYYHNNGDHFYARDLERDDPILVQVVEELGDEANGYSSELAIHELPSGTKYRIDEYDGYESVMTPDSYDWRIAR